MKRNMRERLAAGELCRGTWLSLGTPVIAELAAECGFDWLLLDLEHGYASDAMVLPVLQAVGDRDTAVIVRVGGLDPASIGRILDWGAAGIMAPHISTADEAAGYVAAMNYPPRGTRGYSSSSRAYRYGIERVDDPAALKSPMLLAQIECWDGACRAGEIAAVEGVDVLFVGPSDMKLDLAHRPEADATFDAALDAVLAATGRAKCGAGIVARDRAGAATAAARGFGCIAVGADLGLLREAYRKIVAPIESGS